MLVLAIESSCDETAAAVVRDGRTVLSNIVASQIADHAEYGGVVPEIASRKHMEAIVPVIECALRQARVSLELIEGIAVTQGPGLAGALLVGLATAKAMAYATGKPIIGVNHIEGHLLAIFLEHEVSFPYVALAVSGGHTHLYLVEGPGRYVTLGQTLDDAAGEAFDKVAKLIGLPYPGGAVIDRLAETGDPTAIRFPRPLIHDQSLNFSFSGLKTSVRYFLRDNPDLLDDARRLAHLCASVQAAIVEVLVNKTVRAARRLGVHCVTASGGVTCNRALRRELLKACKRDGLQLRLAEPALCTDNAAMIGILAERKLAMGGHASSLDADIRPGWDIAEAECEGRKSKVESR